MSLISTNSQNNQIFTLVNYIKSLVWAIITTHEFIKKEFRMALLGNRIYF